MPITILHISDLHRDPRNPVTNPALLNSLQCDLERYAEEEPPIPSPDLIIASGDIIQGVPFDASDPDELLTEQYDQAFDFLSSLAKEFVGGALPDVVESPVSDPVEGMECEPAPAIMRPDVECDLKILTTGQKYGQLNDFELFLGLSDRLFKREREFFSSPHTTKVIWGGHRVIYIFGHASGTFTLYYDIELREALSEHQASGSMIPTTTLVTKNRVFVPVPSPLVSEFKISEGAKEFYVRFDTIP